MSLINGMIATLSQSLGGVIIMVLWDLNLQRCNSSNACLSNCIAISGQLSYINSTIRQCIRTKYQIRRILGIIFNKSRVFYLHLTDVHLILYYRIHAKCKVLQEQTMVVYLMKYILLPIWVGQLCYVPVVLCKVRLEQPPTLHLMLVEIIVIMTHIISMFKK